MSERQLSVIHALLARPVGGVQRYLLYPHERWVSAPSGLPVLSLPVKKVGEGAGHRVGQRQLREGLARALGEDLGSGGECPAYRRLAPVTLDLLSPTRREQTRYRIVPLLVHFDAGEEVGCTRPGA